MQVIGPEGVTCWLHILEKKKGGVQEDSHLLGLTWRGAAVERMAADATAFGGPHKSTGKLPNGNPPTLTRQVNIVHPSTCHKNSAVSKMSTNPSSTATAPGMSEKLQGCLTQLRAGEFVEHVV